MKHVISREDREPRGPTSYVFEGYKRRATSVSLHLTDDIAPGEGSRLHRHPLGLIAFLFGAVLWVISLAFRVSIDP